jgi:hypothetical protein
MRIWTVLLLAFVACAASAQSWRGAYEKGLEAARSGNWAEARQSFQQAAAYRPEDVSGPTTLPGPVTEPRRWRNGSPYSPNFLAAYSAYRQGLAAKDTERASLLATAATEFEALLAKNQASREAYFFLHNIYISTAETSKRIALEERYAKMSGQADWKVDTEVLMPEEIAALSNTGQGNITSPVPAGGNKPTTQPTVTPSQLTRTGGIIPSGLAGSVPPVPDKFALIIGNSESRIADGGLPFASDDAQSLREALVVSAGYPSENIDLVINATADQIRTSAKALADRVPDGGTVMIYFTGVGANIDGKDYLAGSDSESITNGASMVSKAQLYKYFSSRGAKVFAFFQANRPISGGRYFGQEIPMEGFIAQTQATMPGDMVSSLVQNGRETGLFTSAVLGVLDEMRSNHNPILEFGWQVFYRMKRGNTGSTGGGSRQTPTLPVLTHIAADARF